MSESMSQEQLPQAGGNRMTIEVGDKLRTSMTMGATATVEEIREQSVRISWWRRGGNKSFWLPRADAERAVKLLKNRVV